MIKLKGIYIEGDQKTLESFIKDFKASLGQGIDAIKINPELREDWE